MGAVLLAIAIIAAPNYGGFSDEPAKATLDQVSKDSLDLNQTIGRIEIFGFRRVRSDTIRALIHSRAGDRPDPSQIERDIRALMATGWFDDVTASVAPDYRDSCAGGCPLILGFAVAERPWLTGFEFGGSRVLDNLQSHELIAKQGLELNINAPFNSLAAWKVAHALKQGLEARGYPNANVRMMIEKDGQSNTVRIRFEMTDGEKIRVGTVRFVGNTAVPSRKLRGEMEIDPHARFATKRGMATYTPERLRADEARLGDFYRDHGYAEAAIGQAHVAVRREIIRTGIFRRKRSAPRLEISVPVSEGPRFTTAKAEIRGGTGCSLHQTEVSKAATKHIKPKEIYSEERLTKLRDYLDRLQCAEDSHDAVPSRAELTVDFDRELRIATPIYTVMPRDLYTLRRLQFTGERRFTDRYYRRHIPIREGDCFDPQELQAGLSQIARAGYIRQVKPEDVRIKYDRKRRSVDVAVHVSEIGRQKFSLIGGQSNLGSTAGIAYSVFNLLGGEELIDSQFEGGPDLLRVALTLSEESVFGTRASMAFTLFDYFVRPNLTSLAGNAHFLNTHTSGFGAGWGYPVAENESLAVNYTDSRAASRYALSLPQDLTGIPSGQVSAQSKAVSHSIGATWDASTSAQHWQPAVSVAGGALGGNQNLLRATAEYDVHERDPFSNGRNSWAIRGYAGAAGSFSGDLQYQNRSFAGQELLRGFRSGEIAPYSEIKLTDALGNTTTQAVSTGANLIDAINAEYRVPISRRFAATGFFDAGHGWIRPNWLGPDRPALLAGTNGLLRGSAGIELQWRTPIIEQAVRVNFSVNVLRLAKTFVLSDGTLFRAPDRRFSLGWAVGPRF